MGWNGSGRPADQPRQTVPAKPRRRGARTLAALALGAVGVTALGLVLFPAGPGEGGGREKPAESAGPAKATRIRETAPAPGPVAPEAENQAVAEQASSATGEVVRVGAHEYDLAKLRKENPAAYHEVTAKYARVQTELERIRRSPVKGAAEQLLALSTPGEKGEAIPPLPLTDADMETMEAEAEKMLATEPKVEEFDTDQSIDIKNRLIELKEEYAAARERGLSFVDFIRDREAKAKNDAEHLQDAIRLDREIADDQSVSDKDYLDSREKINRLLKLEGYKGLPPATEEEAEAREAEAAAEGAK